MKDKKKLHSAALASAAVILFLILVSSIASASSAEQANAVSGNSKTIDSSTPSIFNYCTWRAEYTTQIGKYNKAPASQKYAVITLNINNTGDQTYSTNPNYWHLRNGDVYYQYDVATFDASLHQLTTDVGPGGKISMGMAFLVDKNLPISDVDVYYDGPGSDGVRGSTYSVGGNTDTKPGDISANSPTTSKTYAYIANNLGNTVSVIDTSNNNVVAIVKVGSGPIGVAVSPDGGRAYVTNGGSNTVSVIDTSTNKVTATVKVGSSPNGITVIPDGEKVYVTNYGGNTVSVIDTSTYKVTATVNMRKSPFSVAVNPAGTKVYVTNDNNHTVSVIDTATDTITAIVNVGGQSPGGIAVSPDGTKAYVTSGSNNTVLVIDITTNIVLAKVNVDGNPHGVAFTPDGSKAYVANFNSNTVSVIDTATNTVIATVNVGNGPYGVAFTPDGSKAYVTNDHDNTVSVIDTATNTVIATVNVGKYPKSLGQFIGRKSVVSVVAPVSTVTEQSQSSSSDNSGSSSGSSGSSSGSSDSSSGSSGSSSGSSGSSSGSGSGSSSGSGSGGGGSPEPQSNVEAKELSQVYITSGNPVKFDFPQKATPVVDLSFDSTKTAGKTTTIVEMLKGKSTLVSEMPSDEVYKSFNVWVGNGGFGDSNTIENAVVDFKVEKSWIKDKNINKSSVILNRYSDSKWNHLPTSLSGEDDTYLYYTAKTPGFSPFVIISKTASTEPINETQSNLNIQSLEQNNSSTVANTGKGSTKTPGFEMIYGTISLFAVFLYKESKKDN